MPEVYWRTLVDFAEILAQPAPAANPAAGPVPGPFPEMWRVAARVIHDCTYIRLEAAGQWQALPEGQAETCGPDGYIGKKFDSKDVLLSDCPGGALIGRFGGSSAAFPVAPTADADKGKLFPIGSYCIVPVPEKSIGPLFIGFNIVTRPVRILRLTLKIEGANPTV
jgi:hypothetical protein